MDLNFIDNGIYQGGAVDVLPPGIDAVLDLQGEHQDIFTREQMKAVCWMPIDDGPSPGLPWLKAAVRIVLVWRSAGWTVLIHCAAGVSRSGMVDVAVHMRLNGCSRDKALELVRSKRPQTNPNPNFMALLLEYEKSIGIAPAA